MAHPNIKCMRSPHWGVLLGKPSFTVVNRTSNTISSARSILDILLLVSCNFILLFRPPVSSALYREFVSRLCWVFPRFHCCCCASSVVGGWWIKWMPHPRSLFSSVVAVHFVFCLVVRPAPHFRNFFPAPLSRISISINKIHWPYAPHRLHECTRQWHRSRDFTGQPSQDQRGFR